MAIPRNKTTIATSRDYLMVLVLPLQKITHLVPPMIMSEIRLTFIVCKKQKNFSSNSISSLLQHNACVAVDENACILISLINYEKRKQINKIKIHRERIMSGVVQHYSQNMEQV